MDEATKATLRSILTTLQTVKMEATMENMTAMLACMQVLQKLIDGGKTDG